MARRSARTPEPPPGPLTLVRTSRFKRDYKRCVKQGKDPAKLRTIIEALQNRQPLDPRHRDHALQGELVGLRDCHIEPDWLLLYEVTESELRLVRTGSHAELFE